MIIMEIFRGNNSVFKQDILEKFLEMNDAEEEMLKKIDIKLVKGSKNS